MTTTRLLRIPPKYTRNLQVLGVKKTWNGASSELRTHNSECPVYLTLGALPAQYTWSDTHFCRCGKICTKYADVMRHRVKFSRPGDRDLCTMTLNYPSVRSKISLHGTDPRFLCMYLRCDGILWVTERACAQQHTLARYSELFKFFSMFTSPFFKIHLNTPLPEKFRPPNWRVTTF